MTHFIDENSLRQTAEALAIINPGRASENHIRDMIRANLDPSDNSTYISTAGWIAFTWTDHNGKTHVRVAVEPYSVMRFLQDKGLAMPAGEAA